MNIPRFIAGNKTRALAISMCILATAICGLILNVRPVRALEIYCSSNGDCADPCACMTGGQCVNDDSTVGRPGNGSICDSGTWIPWE